MDAMTKHILDDEQHAPFTMPTTLEVELSRRGIEAIKDRNKRATPILQLVTTHEGNNEL